MSEQKIGRATILNSVIWKFLERFFSQGLNLIIQIILARLIFPEHFGSLAILVSIVNYASIFVQSGLATAIIQKKDLDNKDVSTVLTSSLLVAFIFYIILFVLSPVIARLYGSQIICPTLRVLSLVLFLNAINSVQTAILSRRMNFKILCIRSMIAVPFAGIIGIVLAYLGFGLWSLVIFNLSYMLIVVIVMSFSSNITIRLGFDYSRAKTIYSFSGKILISNLISGAYDFIRTMTIGRKFSRQDLAFYDKANTYSYYIVTILNTTISSVMLPAFSRVQDSISDLKRIARRSIQLSSFVMIPFLIIIAAMAEDLVLVLLTEKWLPCVPYLQLFCILRIPGIIISTDRQVYFAIGRSDVALYYELFLFVINISSLLLVIKFGVIWIAIASCIIEYIGLITITCISKNLYNYSIKERLSDIWLPVFNSLLTALVVFVVSYLNISIFLRMFLQLTLGSATYLLLSKLTNNQVYLYIKQTITTTYKKCFGRN